MRSRGELRGRPSLSTALQRGVKQTEVPCPLVEEAQEGANTIYTRKERGQG